jgi:hypothetical protein
MVVLLAHWCPHCNAEIPVLNEWRDSGEVPDGLNIVGVSTAVSADAPNYPPNEWLQEMDWRWPVLADDRAPDADSPPPAMAHTAARRTPRSFRRRRWSGFPATVGGGGDRRPRSHCQRLGRRLRRLIRSKQRVLGRRDRIARSRATGAHRTFADAALGVSTAVLLSTKTNSGGTDHV